MAWIEDWDDPAEVFLISIGKETGPLKPVVDDGASPFFLTASEEERKVLAKQRKNQRRFAFEVSKRYGRSCAVCDIAIPQLIEAAHVCAKHMQGSDDARNGLPLCANHHRAYDNQLWSIDPVTLNLTSDGTSYTLDELGITRSSISHLVKGLMKRR